MKCKQCYRALRPEKTPVADYPGTITEYAVGYCRTCYRAVVPEKRRAKRPEFCVVCTRRMRPVNTNVADYPDTIQHKAGGLCKTCYMREKKGAEQPLAVEEEIVVGPEVTRALGTYMQDREERKRRQERARRVRVEQEAVQRRFIQSRRAA